MKMYADYIKECHDKEIVITDAGFATYSFAFSSDGIKYGFLYDMYVIPEKRGTKESLDLGNQMHKIAQENGCAFSLSTVDLRNNGAIQSLQYQLKMGFVPIGMQNQVITLRCVY